MSNRSNSQQVEKIISFMEEHPNFAKGKVKRANAVATSYPLWNSLTEQLNDIGPPTKPWKLWRKVWYDLKDESRRKFREEKEYADGIKSGVRRAAIPLNHERIINLLDLRESILGLSGASFGGAGSSEISSIKSEENFEFPEELDSTTNETKMAITPIIINTNNTNSMHPSTSKNYTNQSVPIPTKQRTFRTSRFQNPSTNIHQPTRTLRNEIKLDIISAMNDCTESTENKLSNILTCLQLHTKVIEQNLLIHKESLAVNQKLLEIQQQNLVINERQLQIKDEHYKLLKLYYQKKLDRLSK